MSVDNIGKNAFPNISWKPDFCVCEIRKLLANRIVRVGKPQDKIYLIPIKHVIFELATNPNEIRGSKGGSKLYEAGETSHLGLKPEKAGF